MVQLLAEGGLGNTGHAGRQGDSDDVAPRRKKIPCWLESRLGLDGSVALSKARENDTADTPPFRGSHRSPTGTDSSNPASSTVESSANRTAPIHVSHFF